MGRKGAWLAKVHAGVCLCYKVIDGRSINSSELQPVEAFC